MRSLIEWFTGKRRASVKVQVRRIVRYYTMVER